MDIRRPRDEKHVMKPVSLKPQGKVHKQVTSHYYLVDLQFTCYQMKYFFYLSHNHAYDG